MSAIQVLIRVFVCDLFSDHGGLALGKLKLNRLIINLFGVCINNLR